MSDGGLEINSDKGALMARTGWSSKRLSVTSLHLDARNPRLGPGAEEKSPRDLIRELFEHDKVLEVAESIVRRGYFQNEPLLAVREGNRYVVVEGNRRLAALKALRNPELLEGSFAKQVAKLSRQLEEPSDLADVPVTVAPSRRATDRQLAGRHVGTPVLPWAAESRANFILEKLAEGYSVEELSSDLGFSAADIEAARRTRSIVDSTRSLDLPEEVRAKIDSRRSTVFTTIERVFDSTVGRRFLKIEPDPEHGFRGTTTTTEFSRALAKLVTDVATGEETSRTLNSAEDIARYFGDWDPLMLPRETGNFIPSDLLIREPSPESSVEPTEETQPRRKGQPQPSEWVIPREFRVLVKDDRLIEIRNELTRLKRAGHPNAGAVMLRVFFELAVLRYFTDTGELPSIVARLQQKNALKGDRPSLSQLSKELIRVAKANLEPTEAAEVEKAVTPNKSAPFTISDLNSFVHNPASLPSDRDIQQFWSRVQPIMKLMLSVPRTAAE